MKPTALKNMIRFKLITALEIKVGDKIEIPSKFDRRMTVTAIEFQDNSIDGLVIAVTPLRGVIWSIPVSQYVYLLT